MPESINQFFGGINSDNSPISQPANTYIDGLNIELISDELQGSVALSNSKGNKFQIVIPDVNNIFKLIVIATGSTYISIAGVSSSSPFIASTGFIQKDLYDFIKNDVNLSPFVTITFNVYYSLTNVVIVPTLNIPFLVTVTNNLIITGGDSSTGGVGPYIPANGGLQVIGYTMMSDCTSLSSLAQSSDIYLLTTNCKNKDPQLFGSGYGYIWKLNYDNILFNASSATIQLIYAADLNWTTYYMIHQTAIVPRYENKSIQKIYFTDFYNKFRTINVANPQVFALAPSDLDFTPQVNFDIPKLTSLHNGSGGTVEVGSYQAAYRLKNTTGATTNYSELSNIVNVCIQDENTKPDIYQGGSAGTMVAKTIEWKIDNLDVNFDRIEIVILKRTTASNIPTIFNIWDIPTSNNNSITFVYDGTQTKLDITLEEFILSSSVFTHCKTITTKDNRLFPGNIVQEQLDINYDARAFRAHTNVGTDLRYINNGTLLTNKLLLDAISEPETNDQINPYYTADECYYKPGVTGILGGAGLNISYEFKTVAILGENSYDNANNFEVPNDTPAPWRKTDISYGTGNLNLEVNSPTNVIGTEAWQEYPTALPVKQRDGIKYAPISGLYKGYQRNEVYRFGIQFFDKQKNPMFVKWIGDIKFPDFYDVNNNYYYEDGTLTPHADFRASFVIQDSGGFRQCFVNQLGIEFTVNNLNTISDKISEYSIVRVKRTNKDKHIVAQGYLSRALGAPGSSIFNISPNDSPDGNVVNGTEDTKRQFFITPEFINQLNIAPVNGDILKIKSRVAPANNITSLTIGVGDPYYYFKNYNIYPDNNTTGNTVITELLNIPYGSDGHNSYGYTIHNYDYNTGSGFYNLSHAIGCQTYYFELNSTSTGVNYTALVYGNQLVANIERILSNQYNGNSYSSRATNEYISCNNFRPIREGYNITSDTFQVFGGDIYVNIYDSCRWSKNWGVTGRGIAPSPKVSTTFFLPLECELNTDLRSGFSMNNNFNTSMDSGTETRESYYIDHAYQYDNDIRKYFPKPDPFISNNEFPNRFLASDIKINGELNDSWTSFPVNNYWDVEGTYGAIQSSIILKDRHYFWQDRAFGTMEINPRTLVPDINSLTNAQLQVGTGLPLQRHDYISTTVGSKHQSSTITSSAGLYWFDINTKKIYVYNPGSQEEPLSDIKGLYSYLNKNVGGNLVNIDKPIFNDVLLGINGIMATFDYKRHKAIFTFHSSKVHSRDHPIQNDFTIVYNELTKCFTTRHSFTPTIYINDGKYFFSPADNNLALNGFTSLYIHDLGNYGEYYGFKYASFIKFIINDNPKLVKVFDNLLFDSQSIDQTQGVEQGINMNDDTWNTLRVYNSYQNSDTRQLVFNTNIKRKERTWKLPIPRNRVIYSTTNSPDIFLDISGTEKSFGERIRDKYMTVELTYNNNNNYQLITNNIIGLYRSSER